MPYQTKLRLQRLNRFINRLENSYYKEISPLECIAYVTKEPLSYSDRLKGEKKEIKIGQKWGNLFDCAWFNFVGEIPNEYKDDNLVLLIDINGEGLVFDNNGNPLIGLTNGSSAYEYCTSRKRVVPMKYIDTTKDQINIWVDGGCNDLFGRFKNNGQLEQASIAIRYDELRSLYYDVFVLKSAMENLDKKSPRYHAILHTLDKAQNEMYDFTEEEAKRARNILKKELEKKGGDPSLKISAIGHAHIDLAWLWPIRETIRKGARTFSTVMRLMEMYPDYKFGASQPQLYDWIKRYYPNLYNEVKERIEEKRFEVQGAFWVEADTNISSGEALIRQIIYGKKFYRDEFGIEVKNLWLPDVFGYSGALPQILKKSDVDYFMTQKLCWNQQNAFPYHTFNWEGIDGSEILCHMLAEENYNSPATPESIRIIETNFREKGQSEDALMLYGVGDGGGGPAPHHLERLKRLKNFADFSPVEQKFACDFFEEINKGKDSYRTWVGELYFECHRGTYTTQADNKKYNRKMELALRELEYASILANQYKGIDYPKEELEKIWKEVLLYQFHDILPGSSIKRVYDESVSRYKILYNRVKQMIQQMYSKLLDCDSENYTVFNSLSYDRNEYTKINDEWYKISIPAMGTQTITKKDIALKTEELSINDKCIENSNLKVEFNNAGHIISIYDKNEDKEIIETNKEANVFSVYEDDGDAWDFHVYYDEHIPREFELISQRTYVDGICAVMEQIYKFNKSTLRQKIVLKQESRIIEFDTNVDWQETNKMLRTAFPVKVYTDEVTCNIQFGNIKRPTHRNTTWDVAKFEICAHKWIDISKDDYGVALLSESKYGFKALNNILDMNLLRSPMYPGIDADKGTHSFKYGLYPHAYNEKQANVAKEGYLFNVEPIVLKGTIDTEVSVSINKQFISINKDNIVIESVKEAEEENAIIIRFYETFGINTKAEVKLPQFTKKIMSCNLIERNIEPINMENKTCKLDFTPFEIKTIKLEK